MMCQEDEGAHLKVQGKGNATQQFSLNFRTLAIY
jgi:hypothetical protein